MVVSSELGLNNEAIFPLPEKVILGGTLCSEYVRHKFSQTVKESAEADLLLLPLRSSWLLGAAISACAEERGLDFPPKMGVLAGTRLYLRFEEETNHRLVFYGSRVTAKTRLPLQIEGDENLEAYYQWLREESAKKDSLVFQEIEKIRAKGASFPCVGRVAVVDEVAMGVTLYITLPFLIKSAFPKAEIITSHPFSGSWLDEQIKINFPHLKQKRTPEIVELVLWRDIFSGCLNFGEKLAPLNFENLLKRGEEIAVGLASVKYPETENPAIALINRYGIAALRRMRAKVMGAMRSYGKEVARDSSLWTS